MTEKPDMKENTILNLCEQVERELEKTIEWCEKHAEVLTLEGEDEIDKQTAYWEWGRHHGMRYALTVLWRMYDRANRT